MAAGAAELIRACTRLAAAPFVPEIRLHLAEDPLQLWELTEQALGRTGLPPPFWAFAWAGGQALARYVLDHPDTVRGRRVIDVATGSGLVAIAAAKAGAAAVAATDIDELAVAVVALNARANGVTIACSAADLLAEQGDPWVGDPDGACGGPAADGGALAVARRAEVVLAADVFYEKDLADRVTRILRRMHTRSATVLIGDLGRKYLPRSQFLELAAYDVPVTRALEDADVKRTAVWRPAW